MVDAASFRFHNIPMRFDLSRLGELLEDRPDWVVATAGVLTALLVYAVFRGLVRLGRLLGGAPSKPPNKRGLAYRLGALLFHANDDCLDMDALRNTPDNESAVGEKRTNFRRRDNLVEIMLAVAPGAEPRRAWVVDRSSTGLGILFNDEIEPGTVIGVRPVAAPTSAPWVDVEVRSCAPKGKHQRLGCKFLQTPEWGILLMFG